VRHAVEDRRVGPKLPFTTKFKNPACGGSARGFPARIDPIDVSFGYCAISSRQPWSSVRCQWNRLSLCSAIKSRSFFTTAFGMKCRPTSSMAPRQGKRGASVTRTHGAASGSVAGALPRTAGGRSWRSDWAP
jgi:hypothetical protein